MRGKAAKLKRLGDGCKPSGRSPMRKWSLKATKGAREAPQLLVVIHSFVFAFSPCFILTMFICPV